MSRRENSEINAGSMADIAFLLLIFFLVTTTLEVDSGILRKIPKNIADFEIEMNKRNVLEVNINSNNELFVGDKIVDIINLTTIALQFIDNGGGTDIEKKACDWCKGDKNPTLSDHPSKAFISIASDRNSSYQTYITVLDNLNVAYSILRNRLSKELYSVSYAELVGEHKIKNGKDDDILQKIKSIQKKYPLLVSDIEIKK